MMTIGQFLNGAASGFTAVAGSAFVVSYAILAKWYKSLEGRMMMGYVGALTVTYSLTLILTINGFSQSGDFLRIIQAGLTLMVGIAITRYTYMVWKVQRRKGKL